ncbi:hypothetical protein [Streptosporangium saharense]|uniref:hypothetical protein n=1 Tax=Streptosporangium saharense TaxID=1706840 RepID=UPI003333ED8D
MDFAALNGPARDAYIDAELAFVRRTWKEQVASGQSPLLSASCRREWRAEVLKACACGATSNGCPVHTPV